MTCVGLGLELISRLEKAVVGPGILHLASCEEAVGDPKGYLAFGEDWTDKEHVLVCAHVLVSGRRGVILLDPGYHVARVVTVMEDGKYPHTGWFTQSDESWVKREYRYYFPGDTLDFVLWEVKETRGCKVSVTTNLIYVARPFLNATEVTEKRNLVYNFRSWLARSTKGEIIAGIYFPIQEKGVSSMFTLTCMDANANKQRVKFKFNEFLDKNKVFEPAESDLLEQCAEQLGAPLTFRSVLQEMAKLLSDSDFVSQLLDINEQISNS